MFVSIVVPCYATSIEQVLQFERLLDSIQSQTYREVEVVLVDHSPSELVQVAKSNRSLNITYIRNSKQRGNSSANMNFGMKLANGDLIQVLHMDDFFSRPDAIELMVTTLRSSRTAMWGVLGFDHLRANENRTFNPTMPSLWKTLGCPSATFFRKDVLRTTEFDESLIYINDHDFHQQLILQYGDPVVIPEICVTIQISELQVTRSIGRQRALIEYRFFLDKMRLWQQNYSREVVANKSAQNCERLVIESRNMSQTQSDGKRKLIRRLVAYLRREIHLELEYVRVIPPLEQESMSIIDDDLSRIANQTGTDKGTRIEQTESKQGPRLFFTPIYDFFFTDLRTRQLKILEIGIGSGASIPMWLSYFAEARLYAIDNMRYSLQSNPRLRIDQLDQTDRGQLEEYLREHGPFDVVIDDGGHMMEQQQVSLGVIFPHIRPGGLYFIEDLHTSYWPLGEYRDLYGTQLDVLPDRSNSTVSFLHNFIRTGVSNSPYLSVTENHNLTSLTHKCFVFDLPSTEYGPNHLAVLLRK